MIPWASCVSAGRTGQLAALLETIPREHWRDRGDGGATLLHMACLGDVVAVVRLIQHGLDVNAHAAAQWTPAHVAAFNGFPKGLEALCAAGAVLTSRTQGGLTPLEMALARLSGHAECVRVLLANGVRLSSVSLKDQPHIASWMLAAEGARVCCRGAVVALLALKRRHHGAAMRALDRWVVREIGYAVWSMRANAKWAPPVEADD